MEKPFCLFKAYRCFSNILLLRKNDVSVLAALHWLPVNVRIQLKVFKALKVWLQRVDLSCCSRLLQDEVVDDPLMLPKPDSHPGQSSFLMG